MYVSFFLPDGVVGFQKSLVMVTDGANVLSVRSRTTRSSKGKASLLSLLFSFNFSPDLLIFLPKPRILLTCFPFSLSSYPFILTTSSSPTQKQIHSSSRNNSVSWAFTRPTQLATEIAFSALFLINCTAPSLATSSYGRTFAIGSSHIVSAMPPLSMTNAAWTSTFLSCVNLVSSICSIIGFLERPHVSYSATYGGHLELSAFAHMKKCNVKVIQPGLVYLIEWAAGWDVAAAAVMDTAASSSSSLATTLIEREPLANDRSRRAARRESKRVEREKARADKAGMYQDDDKDKDAETPTVYVA